MSGRANMQRALTQWQLFIWSRSSAAGSVTESLFSITTMLAMFPTELTQDGTKSLNHETFTWTLGAREHRCLCIRGEDTEEPEDKKPAQDPADRKWRARILRVCPPSKTRL